MSKKYAIILARGGSKGIPLKNMVDFNNLPLFMWSVLAALEDDICDQVIVSSDSADILKESDKLRDSRVISLPRPSCYAGDLAPSELAILHALSTLSIDDDACITFLQPTSPFRYGNIIKKCIDEVRSGYSSFTALSDTPLFWNKDTEGYGVPKFSERKMRQSYSDQELYWHDCGNVYSFNAGDFKKHGNRHVGSCKIIEVDKFQSLQIDDHDDLLLCRKLIENENIFTWMKKIAKLLQG
jgi:CMP-N,N'-diacetyllegionaminic acid synthase